jgi:hypothetical protein
MSCMLTPKLQSGMFFFIYFSLPYSHYVCNVSFFSCYISYSCDCKDKVYRKSSSTVLVEPQTVNEVLSVEAEVGLSGTEQSTFDAEHLLTSNSAFESLLIDADHRSAEACTSLLTAAQSQAEALPLFAEVGQYEVVESTVAQALVDVDHALVQSCTSLFSKTQSVIEEFSVAADGDGTELSNSLLVNDNNYVPLAQSSPDHYNVDAAYSPQTSTVVLVNTEALTTDGTDEKSFGHDDDDDFLNSLQVNIFEDATKVANQFHDSIDGALFSNWKFAKYGARVGCAHCMDLFSKGSSYENHSHNCPSISGVYPSSDDSSNLSMAIHQADFCMPCRGVEVEDDFYSACSQEVTHFNVVPGINCSIQVLVENMYSASTTRTLSGHLLVYSVPNADPNSLRDNDDKVLICLIFTLEWFNGVSSLVVS